MKPIQVKVNQTVGIAKKISVVVMMFGALAMAVGFVVFLLNISPVHENINTQTLEIQAVDYMIVNVPSIMPNSLIYYHQFNGNSSGSADGQIVSDSSQYGHNGTVTGASWTSSIEGTALEFDGDADYVQSGLTTNLDVSNSFSTPETSGHQGVATDGEYIYVSTYNRIYKYSIDGEYIDVSIGLPWHTGGITWHNGFIYATVSACVRDGTSDVQWVYKFDQELNKIAEYHVASEFDICVGGIMYFDNNFYVAESYYDNVHNDKIAKYDMNFNHVETYLLDHKCGYGVQGLDYIPSQFNIQINCHNKNFYRINTDFDNFSIESGVSSFDLQDVAYLDDGLSIYNNRAANSIDFVNNEIHQSLDKLIDNEYTIEAWFKITGGENTRRFIIESSDSWALSCEISPNNKLKYSIQTNGNSVIKETNIQPSLNIWHHVAVVYRENEYSKIYFNGTELIDYDGRPTRSLLAIGLINTGTYRSLNGRWFKGMIDEVRIWDRELYASEISSIYNCWNSFSSESCQDNIDNDCDILVDCQDNDCPRTCGVCGSICPTSYKCMSGECCKKIGGSWVCIDTFPVESGIE